MSHYIDILLRPDPEIAVHHLMSALYVKLHRVLAQTQTSMIGASFPGYLPRPATLGTTLRLIGPRAELDGLMQVNWLKGMADHVAVAQVTAVPVDVEHRSLRRIQAKSSPDRLRRRQVRRHGLSAEHARERIPDSSAEVLNLPFVMLVSASTGQAFPLFLRLGPPMPSAQAGVFNAYGLSASATIPWF